MTIGVLDLFSGIGGFAYALHGSTCKTIAYCELQPSCRRVIAHNSKIGMIDKASIFQDIRKLHVGDLKSPHEIKVVTAGFPCQDVSVAGLQKGLVHGEHSSLIWEALRLCEELPDVQVLVLENSPNMLSPKFHDVLSRGLLQHGFHTMYESLFSVTDVGGIIKRTRWFAIALKGPPQGYMHTCKSLHNTIKTPDATMWKTWRHTFCQKRPHNKLFVDAKARSTRRKLCMDTLKMFGNSVVPQVTAHALRILTKCVVLPRNDKMLIGNITNYHPKTHVLSTSLTGKVKHAFIKPVCKEHSDTPLKFTCQDPYTMVSTNHSVFGTPCHNVATYTTYKDFGKRSTANLQNQLAFCITPPISTNYEYTLPDRKGDFIVNPEFVGMLMGYPHGYIRADLLTSPSMPEV